MKKAHRLTEKAMEKRSIRCKRLVVFSFVTKFFQTQEKICRWSTSVDPVHR
jgi:hypothetical protein